MYGICLYEQLIEEISLLWEMIFSYTARYAALCVYLALSLHLQCYTELICVEMKTLKLP